MKKIISTLMLVIFLISLASAGVIVNVDVKSSFGLNEQMSFGYFLVSDTNTQVRFIPHIMCPNAPVAMLQEQTIELQANKPYTAVYNDQIVRDEFESQTCKAYVQILSPVQQIVSKEFNIVTNPSFSVNKKLPADKALIRTSKIYLLGDSIYLDYQADIAGASVSALLTYPNKQTKQITFPITLKADQVGTYTLDITASKAGYKTIKEKEMFGVIAQNPSIKQVSITGNVVSNDTFNKKNWVLIGIILGLIVALLVFIKFKKR